MKYMVTWHPRPHGSATEYENAQNRIIEVFRHWFPESIRVHQFVVRVGAWSGYLLVETDDPAAIRRGTSAFPALSYEVHPVIDIQEAVAADLEAIVWRDGLKIDTVAD